MAITMEQVRSMLSCIVDAFADRRCTLVLRPDEFDETVLRPYLETHAPEKEWPLFGDELSESFFRQALTFRFGGECQTRNPWEVREYAYTLICRSINEHLAQTDVKLELTEDAMELQKKIAILQSQSRGHLSVRQILESLSVTLRGSWNTWASFVNDDVLLRHILPADVFDSIVRTVEAVENKKVPLF